MTVEIGILNKSSVVLAADSAVTISSANKVLNNANKLFPLSLYEPVGIMVYNNANWMGIPFEIIIKSYTKFLGRNSFDSLEQYRENFIQFLKDNYTRFVHSEQIKDFVEGRLYQMLEELIDVCNETLEDKYSEELKNISPQEKEILFEKNFFEVVNELSKSKTTIMPDFTDYKLEDFKAEFKSYIYKILPGFYSKYKISRKPKYSNRITKELYHELICAFSDDEDYSGIVIAGYGNNEIFPTICDLKVGEILSKRIRYQFSNIRKITYQRSAIVSPFAQREMIDSFFKGMSPDIYSEIKNILPVEFEEVISKISKRNDGIDKHEIRQYFKASYKQIMKKIDKFTNENYVNPVISSIGYLRKEDLVELAESLVNITSIKRKTSKNIQSVGGPIDIAVITKHEGFIWIKRKDVINKDINNDYYCKIEKDL